MALTICHTADWHLGHTLYRRSREHEHAAFLAWLLDRLVERRADALIVAGDVFDSASPPGSAQAMFYGFLAEARRRLPGLVIVVIAGNHDSPARLAAPDPVLRGQGVVVVGSVPYDGDRVAVERLVVPMTRDGAVLGRVVAMPFLRAGDLPRSADASSEAQAPGVRQLYDAAIAHARTTGDGAPIVVTGHFAAAGARMSIESERRIAAFADGTLPIDVIDTRGVAYVALGHLHVAQRVGTGPSEVRYAGSPIPLAFAERGLEHEVRFVTIDGRGAIASEGVRVPRTVSLLRVPDVGVGSRDDVVASLRALPANDDTDPRRWPWVEVRASARVEERDVVDAIETAAADRAVHLVRIAIERPEVERSLASAACAPTTLDVRDVLVARWLAEHGEEPGAEVMAALDEATVEARGRIEERRRRAVELEGDRAIARATSLAAHRAAVAAGDD
jgi:exonuclease SbcD